MSAIYGVSIALCFIISDVFNSDSCIFYFLFFKKIFNIYIKRAAEIFGVTHTREIYEKAIEVLPDDQAR